jgi:hypothetical protein
MWRCAPPRNYSFRKWSSFSQRPLQGN